ncbi:hypothetical protein DRO60_03735, partial [Candidatus Bathyarchaeota archaeon]
MPLDQADEVLDSIARGLEAAGGGARLIYVKREVVEEPEPGPEVSQLGLHEALEEALVRYGIRRLYRFQYEAYRALMAGKDIFISSGAATGKTEAFIIPLMDKALKSGDRSVVVYPTKALARDQLGRFQRFAMPFMLRVAVFDGDTPERERASICQNPPQVLITNPDMIHFGMARSARFRRLLRGLKALVLDEAHVYEGSFGSHVRMIIDRLKMAVG